MESKQSKGGIARRDALSPERRSQIAREAAIRRWADLDEKQVYVIGPDVGPVKIGISKSIPKRVASLQSSSHARLNVFYSVRPPEGLSAGQIEWAAHRLLSPVRLEGEWFDVAPDDAHAAIVDAISILQEPVDLIPDEGGDCEQRVCDPDKQLMSAHDFKEAIKELGMSQDGTGRWLCVSLRSVQRFVKFGPSNPAARAMIQALAAKRAYESGSIEEIKKIFPAPFRR